MKDEFLFDFEEFDKNKNAGPGQDKDGIGFFSDDLDLELDFDVERELAKTAQEQRQDAESDVAASAFAALSNGHEIPTGYKRPENKPAVEQAAPVASQPQGNDARDRSMTTDEIESIPITDVTATGEPADMPPENLLKADPQSEEFLSTMRVDMNQFKKEEATPAPRKRIVSVLLSILKGCGYAASFIGGCAVVGLIIFFQLVKNYSDPGLDELFANRALDYTTTLHHYDEEQGEYVVLQELYYDENRIWVNIEDVPDHTQKALIAIEDERFYRHNGVDWKRFTGAVLGWFTGNSSYGGSTLTQQLIKNLTDEDDQTWQRKAQEVMRALYIEEKYEKDDILEYYMNTIYFNYRAFGIGKAAELYFDKTVSELTPAESASLFAIIKSPSYYEPYYHPDNNSARKNIILAKMYELGYLDQGEYEAAKSQHLSFNPDGMNMALESTNSYFVDMVIEDILKDLQTQHGYSELAAEQYLFSAGLQIYTTMDYTVQTALEEAFNEDSNFPKVRTEKDYEAAAMLIDYTNGHIIGVVGGRGVKDGSRSLNRATHSSRQPGSSIKPLSVYLSALETGVITEGSVYDDVPVTYMGGEPYPQNFSRVFYGRTSMFYAIQQSLNATPANILMDLGFENAYNFLVDSLHFSTLVRSVYDSYGNHYGDANLAALSMGAFTYGVTVKDMTAGYAAVAAGGVYRTPISYTKVTTPDGRTILENVVQEEQACSAENAWLLQDLLVDGVRNGIAAPGSLSIPLAAKTGTSTDNHDKWFVGYTPYFAAALWAGYDEPDNLSTAGMTSSGAKLMWKKIMQHVVDAKGWKGGELAAKPANIIQGSFCADCGMLPGPNCLLDIRGERVLDAWYVEGTQPTETCTCHVAVYRCTTSGRIAHDNCPDATLVAMVNAEREFLTDLPLDDAAYIYRPIPDGTPLATSGIVFANLLQPNTFAGTATKGLTYNYLCTSHARSANPQLYNPNVATDPIEHSVKMPSLGNGYTTSPSAGTTATAYSGERFIFTVRVQAGYTNLQVYINGVLQQPSSSSGNLRSFTINPVTQDYEIEVLLSREDGGTVRHPVIMPDVQTGLIFSPGAGTMTECEDTEVFIFSVTAADGYGTPVIYANGRRLTHESATGRTYTYSITVTGPVLLTASVTPT